MTATQDIIRCNNQIGEIELKIRLLKAKKHDLNKQIYDLENERSVFRLRHQRLVREELAETSS